MQRFYDWRQSATGRAILGALIIAVVFVCGWYASTWLNPVKVATTHDRASELLNKQTAAKKAREAASKAQEEYDAALRLAVKEKGVQAVHDVATAVLPVPGPGKPSSPNAAQADLSVFQD